MNEAAKGLLMQKVDVLDHGYVMLVDVMGDDQEIAEAARVSYALGTKKKRGIRGLLDYLMRKHHSSPFEMGELKFEVKLPLFVERQWVRHRTCSMNEMSGRYSEFPEEWHLPDEFRLQDTTNKQGSFGDLDRSEKEIITANRRTLAGQAWEVYRMELEAGVAREQARENLPVSVYTKKVWKMDLHNLFHFLKLRTDSHAQKEIRVYAEVIEGMVAACFPRSYEAWRNHVKDSVTLSRDEQVILALLLGDNEDLLVGAAEQALNKSRASEFASKLLRITSEPPEYLASFLQALNRSPEEPSSESSTTPPGNESQSSTE